jgi:hypothetical protein
MGSQLVAPCSHDALMSMRGNPKHLLREIVDVLVELGFQNVGADQALLLNGVEEFVGILLGLEQRGGAIGFYFLDNVRLA